MKEITLQTLLDIPSSELSEWTICFNNANAEGVYSFEQDAKRLTEHISWKKGATKKVSFRRINTKYCLQFIRLDKDFKFDEWLFLGAFEVKGYVRYDDGHETYDLVPMEIYSEYVERLIVRFKKRQAPSRQNFRRIILPRLQWSEYLKKNISMQAVRSRDSTRCHCRLRSWNISFIPISTTGVNCFRTSMRCTALRICRMDSFMWGALTGLTECGRDGRVM